MSCETEGYDAAHLLHNRPQLFSLGSNERDPRHIGLLSRLDTAIDAMREKGMLFYRLFIKMREYLRYYVILAFICIQWKAVLCQQIFELLFPQYSELIAQDGKRRFLLLCFPFDRCARLLDHENAPCLRDLFANTFSMICT